MFGFTGVRRNHGGRYTMVKNSTDEDNTTKKLKVFVSSTISDLKDLRSSLYNRLHNWGLYPIAFEAGSIVINPSKDVIAACIKAASECDVFVLIISGKFGSEYENENISITWKEYRTARESDAVIIPFIHHHVLAIKKFIGEYKNELNGYLTNKRLKETDTIDDIRILEFIDEIEKNKDAYFSFSDAEDLISLLATQLQLISNLPIGKIDYIFDLLKGINLELKSNIEISDLILSEMESPDKTTTNYCFKNSSVNYLVDRGLFTGETLGLELEGYTRSIDIANNFLLVQRILGSPEHKKAVKELVRSTKEQSKNHIKKIEERISSGIATLSSVRKQ